MTMIEKTTDTTPASPPVSWPLSDQKEQAQLEAWFSAKGIDFNKPGIHDQRAFLKAEQVNPRVLEFVSRYVEARKYSDDELLDASRKIRIASEAVSAALERDGGLGKCIVAASSLSRMLDELGIWNYTAKANVSVHFPSDIRQSSRHFYSMDITRFEAPHAIVVAPPFAIIDPSIKFQAYDTPEMRASIPGLVISDEMRPYRPLYRNMISPELRALRRLGDDERQLELFIKTNSLHMLDLMAQLPPRQTHFGKDGCLEYAIVAIGGYPEKLHDLVHPNTLLDGLSPLEIFKRDVQPFVA
ncbi:hypothetical protein Jab_2c34470 [Janthinobacterium sp. HH01]|uniref:hypothetical protein n=1 Tax=Janthinobacterium sp. HH01 TaxID=1198452 RepID=UPI0002AE805C|nr:hypothetical protein [Janthinobacterium sp. HH01]ELX11329.1 hypothetical protein Jab_2c34470 [Janthinobacterium sp. HH01]